MEVQQCFWCWCVKVKRNSYTKAWGETLKSWRKGGGSKTLGKFRKEAARCDQRSLRIGGREEEGRTETRLEAGYG